MKKSMIVGVIATVGLSAVSAHAVTITSGVTSGIKALAATRHTTYYNFDSGCYEFETFNATTFANARSAGAAQVLSTPLPLSWNNSGNTSTGWTTAGGSTVESQDAMDAAGARWIHNSTDSLNGGGVNDGVSVLYAIPFTPTTSVVNLTIYFVTDNGLGSRNGANGQAGHDETGTGGSDFRNDGLYLNEATLGYSSTPNGGGEPTQFDNITKLTFNNLTVNANNENWLYFYQFNWGTYGGSAFTMNIEMVPLPPAAWAGLGSLACVAGFGVIRRRRMAAH